MRLRHHTDIEVFVLRRLHETVMICPQFLPRINSSPKHTKHPIFPSQFIPHLKLRVQFGFRIIHRIFFENVDQRLFDSESKESQIGEIFHKEQTESKVKVEIPSSYV